MQFGSETDPAGASMGCSAQPVSAPPAQVTEQVNNLQIVVNEVAELADDLSGKLHAVLRQPDAPALDDRKAEVDQEVVSLAHELRGQTMQLIRVRLVLRDTIDRLEL